MTSALVFITRIMTQMAPRFGDGEGRGEGVKSVFIFEVAPRTFAPTFFICDLIRGDIPKNVSGHFR